MPQVQSSPSLTPSAHTIPQMIQSPTIDDGASGTQGLRHLAYHLPALKNHPPEMLLHQHSYQPSSLLSLSLLSQETPKVLPGKLHDKETMISPYQTQFLEKIHKHLCLSWNSTHGMSSFCLVPPPPTVRPMRNVHLILPFTLAQAWAQRMWLLGF